MTRSAGSYFSGESIGNGSYGEVERFPHYATFLAMVAAITSIKSHGVQAWDVIDVVDTYDYVFHSVGDRSLGGTGTEGDCDIYFRMRCDTSGYLRWRMYYDWSTVSHSGNIQTSERSMVLGAFSAVRWTLVGNEYELAMSYYNNGVPYWVWIGQPIRHSYFRDGIARLSAATSGTGTQALSVDRSLVGKIRVGQKLWLMNRTPIGSALKTAAVDIATVTAVAAGTVTVSGITHSPFEIGSLLGWKASCPCFSYTNDVGFGVVRADGTPYACGVLFNAIFGATNTLLATDARPGSTGAYQIRRIEIDWNQSGYDAPMGMCQLFWSVPRACFESDVDFFLDCDTSKRIMTVPYPEPDGTQYVGFGPVEV